MNFLSPIKVVLMCNSRRDKSSELMETSILTLFIYILEVIVRKPLLFVNYFTSELYLIGHGSSGSTMMSMPCSS